MARHNLDAGGGLACWASLGERYVVGEAQLHVRLSLSWSVGLGTRQSRDYCAAFERARPELGFGERLVLVHVRRPSQHPETIAIEKVLSVVRLRVLDNCLCFDRHSSDGVVAAVLCPHPPDAVDVLEGLRVEILSGGVRVAFEERLDVSVESVEVRVHQLRGDGRTLWPRGEGLNDSDDVGTDLSILAEAGRWIAAGNREMDVDHAGVCSTERPNLGR